MQPLHEPTLHEPKYARDEYYAELHSKWAQRTAELLDPKKGGTHPTGNPRAAAGGGGKKPSTSFPSSSSRPLMMTTARDAGGVESSRQAGLAVPGATPTTGTKAAERDHGRYYVGHSHSHVDGVEGDQHQQQHEWKAVAAPSSSAAGIRNAAFEQDSPAQQRFPTVSPPTPSVLGDLGVAVGGNGNGRGGGGGNSPLARYAEKEQEDRIKTRRRQSEEAAQQAAEEALRRSHERPEELFNPVSFPTWKATTQAQQQRPTSPESPPASSAATAEDRSPPRPLHSSGQTLESTTPIVKMQLVQEKLRAIAEDGEKMTTDQLQTVLREVEQMLHTTEGDGVESPVPGTPQQGLLGGSGSSGHQHHQAAGEVDTPPTSRAAIHSMVEAGTQSFSTLGASPVSASQNATVVSTAVGTSPTDPSGPQPHPVTTAAVPAAQQPPAPPSGAPAPPPNPADPGTQYWQTYLFYAAAYQQWMQQHPEQANQVSNDVNAGAQKPPTSPRPGAGPHRGGRHDSSSSSKEPWQKDPRLRHRQQTVRERSPSSGSGRGGKHERKPVPLEQRPPWSAHFNTPELAQWEQRSHTPTPKERAIAKRKAREEGWADQTDTVLHRSPQRHHRHDGHQQHVVRGGGFGSTSPSYDPFTRRGGSVSDREAGLPGDSIDNYRYDDGGDATDGNAAAAVTHYSAAAAEYDPHYAYSTGAGRGEGGGGGWENNASSGRPGNPRSRSGGSNANSRSVSGATDGWYDPSRGKVIPVQDPGARHEARSRSTQHEVDQMRRSALSRRKHQDRQTAEEEQRRAERGKAPVLLHDTKKELIRERRGWH